MGQLCSCHSGKSRRRKDVASSWSNLLSKRSAFSSWRRRRMRSEEFLGDDNLPFDPNSGKTLLHVINRCDKHSSFASRRTHSAPEQNGISESELSGFIEVGRNDASDLEPNGVGEPERNGVTELDEGIERLLCREVQWNNCAQEMRRRRVVTHQWQRSNGAKSLDLPGGLLQAEGNLAPPMLVRRLLNKRVNCQMSLAEAPPGNDPWNCARLVEGAKEWLCDQLDPWALLQSLQGAQHQVDCGALALELGRCTTKTESCRCLLDYATNPSGAGVGAGAGAGVGAAGVARVAADEGQQQNFRLVRQALSSSDDKRLQLIAEFLEVVDAIVDLTHFIRCSQSRADRERTLCDPQETLASSSGDRLNGIPSKNPLPDLEKRNLTPADLGRNKDGYLRSEIVHPTQTRPCLYATCASVDRGQIIPVRRDQSFTSRRHSALCHPEDEPSNSWLPSPQPEVPSLSISLYNINLSVECMNELTRILVKYSHVTHLSIVRTSLEDPRGFGELCRAFDRCSQGIVHFDFRMNHLLDGDCLGQLSCALRCATALRSINLSSTGLSAEACRCLMEAIGTGSAANRVLAELDLGFNELHDDGCCAVSELIELPACWLRKLRLRHNGIGLSGARRLATALLTHPRLTLLDVSSNPIGDSGVLSLAESLLGNRTLRDVALDDCGISGEGCRGVARMLTTNTALRSLTLSRNSLGDVGVRMLAEGVRYNRTLEVLGIDMCCLGNIGFVCLLQELRWCHSMRVVRACYNSIGIPDQLAGHRRWSSATVCFDATPRPTGSEPQLLDVYVQLCEVLRLNPKLKIFLWGNRLDEDDNDVTSASVFTPEVGDQRAKWRRSRSAVDSGYGTLS